MLKKLTAGIAFGALALATPLAAQDGGMASEEMSEAKMDEFTAMMAGMFQSEPLSAEQEARLPAATSLVGKMMPEGFYAEMMGDMMDKMMRPMMSMFASPEFILASRLSVEDDAMSGLDEAQQAEILTMLDPAWDQRIDAIMGVVMGNMGDIFTTMEPPMREGLSKAYAVRFEEQQLADIATFFDTPTGSVFARESMALFADPQVMSASMQALPQMMGSFTNMETAMDEAMAALPAERSYEDLTIAERNRLAALLGLSLEELEYAVITPGSAAAEAAADAMEYEDEDAEEIVE